MNIYKTNNSNYGEYIDFDKCLNTGKKLINSEKKSLIGLYIIVSIYTGLRISDILSLKWVDLSKNYLNIVELKSNKQRTIKVNSTIHSVLNNFNPSDENDFIFKSQKRSVFSVQQINRLLKEIFIFDNVSSRSLRKAFYVKTIKDKDNIDYTKTIKGNEKEVEYVSNKKVHTYLMKNKRNGLYKIGKSITPAYRERTLQSEEPEIEMVKLWVDNIEETLHKKYHKYRIRGEWFKLSKTQVKYICRCER